MRLSQTGLGTIRVNNLDKSYPAQDILLQTNQLVQYGTAPAAPAEERSFSSPD